MTTFTQAKTPVERKLEPLIEEFTEKALEVGYRITDVRVLHDSTEEYGTGELMLGWEQVDRP
jgi:hypothetical protein